MLQVSHEQQEFGCCQPYLWHIYTATCCGAQPTSSKSITIMTKDDFDLTSFLFMESLLNHRWDYPVEDSVCCNPLCMACSKMTPSFFFF